MSPSLLAKIHLASLIVRKNKFSFDISCGGKMYVFVLKGNDVLAGENISNARLLMMSKSNSQYFIVGNEDILFAQKRISCSCPVSPRPRNMLMLRAAGCR